MANDRISNNSDIVLNKESIYLEANEFLKALMEIFIGKIIKFYDRWKIPLFIYSERQIHTALAPAMAELTNMCYQMEPPKENHNSKRKKGERMIKGWIDYWAFHDPTDFLIELKNCHVKLEQKKTKRESWVKTYLTRAIDQIKKISDEELSYFTSEDSKDVYTIALVNVSVFSLTIKSIDDIILRNKMCEFEINNKANWIGIWYPSKNQIQEYKKDNKDREKYLAVVWVAHIQKRT